MQLFVGKGDPIAVVINLDPAPTTIPVLEDPLFLPIVMVPSETTVAPLLTINLLPGPAAVPIVRVALMGEKFVQCNRLPGPETRIRLFDSALVSPSQNSLPP